MVRLSAVIITFNEARNIARCIASLQGVADEVIVLDSFSSDDTVSIAEAAGALVRQMPFEGYGLQKKRAESLASHDWILNLDADEALSDELRASLLAFKSSSPSPAVYSVNILPNYCGAWIRHSGWYPAPKLRLWHRHAAQMNEDRVHEGLQIAEGTPHRRLSGDILHYSFPTISVHMKKIEHYSETGARFDVARGKKCSLFKLVLAPKWEFFRLFILQRGFLDGYYGYLVCRNSSIASFIKYQKIRQYTRDPGSMA